MEKKNETVNSINQERHVQHKQTNNMDFALSFIAGTLIGSAVGYAIKPFVNHAIDYTQEHELTNIDKQSQKIREEALRKADEIKEKAQQIKNQALNKKTEEPTAQQLGAQQRAIKQEIDRDKLEAPTASTYHFSTKKDKPVDLAQLKSRQNVMTTNASVSEVTEKETTKVEEKVEKVEPKAKEEASISSLAAMRQAMAVDKPVKVEEKTDKVEPKAKEEASISSLAAMRQAMAVDKPVKVEEKTDKVEPKAKEEVSVSSLAAMRQAMAVDKPVKVEEKTDKVEQKKAAQTKKASQPKGKDAVQRNKQTNREARFENGVITHEAAPKPKKQSKNTPKKRTTNVKKTKTNKAKTQKRNSKVEKHTFKN